MKLKLTFLNSALAGATLGGVSVTFVDYRDHKAVNEPVYTDRGRPDTKPLSLESKIIFESWR